MKTALLLLALLLLGSASVHAGRDHGYGPNLDRRVMRCIKKRDCLGDGWRSMCARNQDGAVGAFPNACYLRCANEERGVHWEKLYSYRTSRHCIKNWLNDPECSSCSAERHHDRPHGGKGKGH